MSTSLSPIGLIGAGNMGGGMARRLLQCGHVVHVVEIDELKSQQLADIGALSHASASDLPSVCDFSIVAVVDAAQTREVLFGEKGLVRGLLRSADGALKAPYASASASGSARVTASRSAHCVMLCPTISPTDTEDIAAELARHGVDSIDAPMSGGPKRAQDGSMSLMVACTDVVFAAHQSLLNTLSSQVFKISSRVGDDARMKLCNNLLAGIHLAGAAEVFAMAERLGLDLNTVLQVVAQSSGQSWMASDRMPRALVADFAPRAHMSLLAKDTRLALDMATAAGIPNTLGLPAAAAFAGAIKMGLADLDDAALLAWARAQLDYAP